MDLDSIKIVKAIARRLEWTGERQRVLAENIANADTPGYKPRDVKEVSFSELVRGPDQRNALAVTAPGHIAHSSASGAEKWRSGRSKGEFEVAPNGNAVNLEQQSMLLAQNQGEHNLMTNLYRKQVGLLRRALGPRQQ
ncbi:flagellar basal body protein [Ferrovibrio sp.]|uniref:flagellar basal body protein n=1 Tax=Ferrovibrio sp. TaxID=1917215 RepID=UPI001B4EDC6D|nr:flagellar basal body protein [Ferrovibrio sp.]MBP7063718.1 flagellar basal body rod protein FlgB [Ferrovibrio sp.]